MRISISYPPLKSEKGIACLSQNRQFQWFSNPTYIYPVIPAYLATMLKNIGHKVFWDDAIAQGLSYKQWEERIIKDRPDIIVMETKTPVIKKHWEIINELKSLKVYKAHKVDDIKSSPFEKGGMRGIKNKESKNKILPSPPLEKEGTGWDPKIVLVGDHVTALPEESLRNSKVDYVIAGGDYDFAVLNLINHLNKKEKLKGGIWYKDHYSHKNNNPNIINTGPMDLTENNLDNLPIIDRQLTRWKDYAYKNGNFKFTPGAYLMSGRDCWWGKCSFCSWANMFPGDKYRRMSPQEAIKEIKNLISLGVKEIMEDSGTLPIGDWLENFCKEMIRRGYNKKISLGCNMRINGIQEIETWQLMKKAGFRFVLFGLESANQKTLDKINKNLQVEDVELNLKKCKQAGLEPHITTMVGYPWETKQDAQRTINFTKNLFKKGYIDTLQATLVIPYPGTSLYKYCQNDNLLLTNDYRHYDQRQPVMKSLISEEDIKKLIRNLYKSFASPKFIWQKIKFIRNWSDIKFLWKAFWKWLGHLIDFSARK